MTSTDWEKPRLPAYMTTVRSPSPSSARYALSVGPGWMASQSTKLGMTRTSVVRSPSLARTLAARSSDSTVTASLRP